MASWDLLSLISFFHLQDKPLRLEQAAQAGGGPEGVGVVGERSVKEDIRAFLSLTETPRWKKTAFQ